MRQVEQMQVAAVARQDGGRRIEGGKLAIRENQFRARRLVVPPDGQRIPLDGFQQGPVSCAFRGISGGATVGVGPVVDLLDFENIVKVRITGRDRHFPAIHQGTRRGPEDLIAGVQRRHALRAPGVLERTELKQRLEWERSQVFDGPEQKSFGSVVKRALALRRFECEDAPRFVRGPAFSGGEEPPAAVDADFFGQQHRPQGNVHADVRHRFYSYALHNATCGMRPDGDVLLEPHDARTARGAIAASAKRHPLDPAMRQGG
jgi:hypothetical protein